jgi:uncharacterized protein (TIGR03435 family)
MKHPNRLLLHVAISAAILSPHAAAQTPNSNLKFEVATIKFAGPLTGGATAPRAVAANGQPELLNIRSLTVKNLVTRAFGVKANQVLGPTWLDQIDAPRYDVSAKVPAGSSREDTNVMLQNLLIERFGLTFHGETRDVQGYELAVGKNGSKLKQSEPVGSPPPVLPANQAIKIETDRNGLPQLPAGRVGILFSAGAGRAVISGRQQTTAQLATALEGRIGKPILDKTGLTAKYDFALAFDMMEFAGEPGALSFPTRNETPAADPAPSIFTAVQQELGLRLESKKVPVDFIVIDKANKTPTEN